MGKSLMGFYDSALDLGGLEARVRLAQLTRMGPAQAEVAEDSALHIQIFDSAFYLIKQEFSGNPLKSRRTSSLQNLKKRLSSAYSDLMNNRNAILSDLSRAAQTITEVTANSVLVERASVWFYDSGKTLIRCFDLFSTKTGSHSSGIQLLARDFPSYFSALETERAIAATDAHTDPRTSKFSEPYLRQFGINSMLDVPIWAHDKMVGVVCHEHTGPVRKWLLEEEDFATHIGSFMALAVEKNGLSF